MTQTREDTTASDGFSAGGWLVERKVVGLVFLEASPCALMGCLSLRMSVSSENCVRLDQSPTHEECVNLITSLKILLQNIVSYIY